MRRLLVMIFVFLCALAGISLVIAFVLGGNSPSQQTLGSNPLIELPRWIQQEHLPPAAVQGAKLFAVTGCTDCHTYAGSGQANLKAPDLTAIGSRHLGIAFEVNHLRCPSCVNLGSPMPAFGVVGNSRLHQLAVFLEDSKGINS